MYIRCYITLPYFDLNERPIETLSSTGIDSAESPCLDRCPTHQRGGNTNKNEDEKVSRAEKEQLFKKEKEKKRSV